MNDKTGNGQNVLSAVLSWIRENINLFILLLMILIGTCASQQFLTSQNILNFIRQISINGIMAAGVTFVLLAGGFDLSIGSILGVCGCLAIGLQGSGVPLWAALVCSILAGCLLGLLNGILLKVTRGGLSETFLITLGTSLVAQYIALTYTKGNNLYSQRGTAFSFIGQGNVAGIPFATILMILIMIILQFILVKTRYGRMIFLTGGNKETAFLSGVPVLLVKITTFMIAGACAATAGIVTASRTTSASYTMGNGADFDACIAALIGGNILGGGKGGMVQTLIGVCIFGLITNILNLSGVNSVLQMVIKGLVLLLAVALDGLKKK